MKGKDKMNGKVLNFQQDNTKILSMKLENLTTG